MHEAFLLLGGNLGNREKNLRRALELIEKNIGRITFYSSVYETEPWGFRHPRWFLNQLAVVRTKKTPEELLEQILQIELFLGRERAAKKWKERTLDIDILFYDDAIVETSTVHIPHPYLHLRRFALAPLAEVVPAKMHPVLKKNMTELLEECPDDLIVYHAV